MMDIHLIIYYGSFLSFPFLIWMIYLTGKRRFYRYFSVPFLVLSLLFIYARFVEPQWITIEEHTLKLSDSSEGDRVRIVLVSDMHQGLYKGPNFLRRVVERINILEGDVVLIPGDFVYSMSVDSFEFHFTPLLDIHAPTYATLGNHDLVAGGGEFTHEVLDEQLLPYVNLIDNQKVDLKIKDHNVTLIGIGDLWAQESDVDLLEPRLTEDHLVIAMTHNPDTFYEFPFDSADLAVAGHTHGGQIRIPWIYPKVIPTQYPFDKGWYEINGNKAFVTSGVGEIGLPMRLFVPPEIVVIDVML